MSRIGKKPILIPQGVEVKVEGQKVMVKGPKGELSREVRPELLVEIKEKQIFVTPSIETKRTNAFWGLERSLIANLVEGVTKGYEKKLEMEGLGYKAKVEGDNIVLDAGFSHSVKLKIPEGIKIVVEKNTISIAGINKELVGQTASTIRKVRPPEPYKGKGIRYEGEYVRRKEGKRAAGTTE